MMRFVPPKYLIVLTGSLCVLFFLHPQLLSAEAALRGFGFSPDPVKGMVASPHPFLEIQPDGTEITLHIRGDA
ncbi:MAG: hypothetical protein QF732_09620, partial [Nitrospinaceae bacterium]|nr:hypothetical protein [Nitrospinaceae bacterium]